MPRRSLAFDIGGAALLALLCLPAMRLPFDYVVLVVLCGALTIRRVAPGLALAGAWVGALVQMLTLQNPGPADLAILGVLYATAAYGSRVVRWLGLASAGAGAVVAAVYIVFVQPAVAVAPGSLIGQVPEDAMGGFLGLAFFGVGTLAVLGLSWTLGQLARTVRTAREARVDARIAQERAAYDVAVEQERTRIARDMHDVVAHSLAVVIAQADGARYASAGDPTAQSEALTTIAATSRTALGDVRLLLAELRHDGVDGPQPLYDDIDGLVGQMRAAGLDVRARHSGERAPIGSGHEIAAYRIVQEALTNALRHGSAGEPVTLELEWQPTALRIRVENRIGSVVGSGQGHGLPGMRERAVLAGGDLTAGPIGEPADRFEVVAVIPVPSGVGAPA